MAKKTKKSSKRNLTASQRIKFSAQAVREIAPLLQNERKKIINEATRASLANEALTLHPHIANPVARLVGPINHHDAAIRKAFAEFGLDPEVPRHWRLLLGCLAEEHFAASPTENRYLKIRAEFEKRIKTEKRKNVVVDLADHYSISVRAIFEALKRSKAVFGY